MCHHLLTFFCDILYSFVLSICLIIQTDSFTPQLNCNQILFEFEFKLQNHNSIHIYSLSKQSLETSKNQERYCKMI